MILCYTLLIVSVCEIHHKIHDGLLFELLDMILEVSNC